MHLHYDMDNEKATGGESMHRMQPRAIEHTLVSVLIAVGLLVWLAGCTSRGEPTPAVSAAEPQLFQQAAVSVSGKVVPQRRAELGFGTSGTVAEVLVGEGMSVMAGQVLARLDAPELTAAIAQAEAALQAAHAQLALLEAGASDHDIAVAEAAVAIAREAASTAQANVDVARTQVRAAEATLQAGRAQLALLQAGARPEEIEVARQRVEQARSQLYALQAQRDAIGGAKGSPGYNSSTYEAAEGQVFAAEDAVEIAELQLAALSQGAREQEIVAAEAQVAQSLAALAGARAQVAVAEQQVLAAQAQVLQAEAQRDRVAAASRDEELAVARASVAQAEAAIQAAHANAQRAEIRAPFGGTVASISLHVGEQATPGAAVISLGDLETLQIETTDLDEFDVDRVAVGSRVSIELDALPGATFGGVVERVSLKAGSGTGGTTFTAYIGLDDVDARLRWGMTAFVEIETE